MSAREHEAQLIDLAWQVMQGDVVRNVTRRQVLGLWLIAGILGNQDTVARQRLHAVVRAFFKGEGVVEQMPLSEVIAQSDVISLPRLRQRLDEKRRHEHAGL